MKIKEIRDLNIEEIKKLVKEKRAKLLKLRFDITSKQVKNHRECRKIKKDIAKVMTVIREIGK